MDNAQVLKLYKEYLKNKGIKQRYIAVETGIKETELSHFKNGRRKLSNKHLQVLLQYIYLH